MSTGQNQSTRETSLWYKYPQIHCNVLFLKCIFKKLYINRKKKTLKGEKIHKRSRTEGSFESTGRPSPTWLSSAVLKVFQTRTLKLQNNLQMNAVAV